MIPGAFFRLGKIERSGDHSKQSIFVYNQPLPITRYEVRFYAKNNVEYLPIESTAFKTDLFQQAY